MSLGQLCTSCRGKLAGKGGHCAPCAAGTVPTDSHTGCTACPAHAYSNSSGVCVECATGYEPTSSRTACVDIDECLSSPCQNGASCFESTNSGVPPVRAGVYRCECTPGWTAPNCNVDHDECASRPCRHGSICTDSRSHVQLRLNVFFCVCSAGYTGSNCETDLDECASAPCQNDGTCRDAPASFLCNCTTGWHGELCSDDVNECISDPCSNAGVCSQSLGDVHVQLGAYVCACVAGFRGDRCDIDIDECLSHPCQNAARCVDSTGGAVPSNDFHCLCERGYGDGICDTTTRSKKAVSTGSLGTRCLLSGSSGGVCALNIDECVSLPCDNGGSCHDGIDDFKCVCVPAFHGEKCSIDTDECLLQNGGCDNLTLCTNVIGGYICGHCPRGFVGSGAGGCFEIVATSNDIQHGKSTQPLSSGSRAAVGSTHRASVYVYIWMLAVAVLLVGGTAVAAWIYVQRKRIGVSREVAMQRISRRDHAPDANANTEVATTVNDVAISLDPKIMSAATGEGVTTEVSVICGEYLAMSDDNIEEFVAKQVQGQALAKHAAP